MSLLSFQQARVEGHKQGQDDQVRHLQRELQSDMYKDTDARHKDMLITLRVGTLQYTTVYHKCATIYCVPIADN